VKCPHCVSEIGFPYPFSARSKCLYCDGKITYAFKASKALLLAIPCGILCWLIFPYIGAWSALLSFALSLAPAVYLDKRYY